MLVDIVADTIRNYLLFGAVFGVLTVAELVLPRSRVSLLARLRAASFWVFYIPTMAIVATLSNAMLEALGFHEPLLTLAFGTGLLGSTAAAILGAVTIDFFFYWTHRAEHRFLWRFHGVHHSVTEMSALGSYHHITEELFRAAGILIPMSLLVSLNSGPAPGLVTAYVFGQGFYIHSSTRLNLGPLLRYLLVDNVYHRVHHAVDPALYGKNFAAFTPLWDVVFGTAYFPKPGEWPEVGLPDRPEPQGFVEWLTFPWRPTSRSDQPRTPQAAAAQ